MTDEEIIQRFEIPIVPWDKLELGEEFAARFMKLARRITTNLPNSRERSLALTALEESQMWVNRTIARHDA